FPPLYCGRLTCGLRGDFGQSRIGEGSLRRGNKTPAVYNRPENEPRHEDYERSDKIMFTHVVFLFWLFFLEGVDYKYILHRFGVSRIRFPAPTVLYLARGLRRSCVAIQSFHCYCLLA